LGYLDWASQPDPFRSFAGAPQIVLPRRPQPSSNVTYDQLFQPGAVEPLSVSVDTIADLLRHSLGLSAWKQFGGSRWSLRVNPSSGNLHPTEVYVVAGTVDGLPGAGVYHYAPDRHALERRCAFAAEAWRTCMGDPSAAFLI